MLRFANKVRVASTLIHSQKQPFGVFQAFMHYIRSALNKVRWEENQQFTSLQQRNSNVPKNPEQATKLYIATERQISLNEKDRMLRIDQILGTNTHFHEGKIFHERIDSDHLMEIQQLQRENPVETRQNLNWLNPQADVKIRYKNKRKYYHQLSKLRIYPSHEMGNYDLSDQRNEQTINFLAAETAYTTISLKPVELTATSLEEEGLMLPPERPFQTQKYSYFRPQFSMQLLRVSKVPLTENLYNSSLLTDQKMLMELGSQVEEVISLDEIYETLKQYDTDERVRQYLKKVQNNRMDYLFADLSFDKSQNVVAVTIDILDNGIQHCLLVKSFQSNEKTLLPIFNMKPPVIFSADGRDVYYIQRSAEGGWIQLVKRSVESCWGKFQLTLAQEEQQGIIYKCSPDKQIKLGKDTNHNMIFVTIKEYAQQYSEKLLLVSSRQDSLQLIPVDEDGKCQYFYDLSSQGLIIAKKRKVESGDLKYGKNQFYIESIQLIPFKQHIQIHSQSVGLTDLLPGKVEDKVINPEDFDFLKKRCIFSADQFQFITDIKVKSTHLVIVLNYFSIYDRAILYLLPFRASAHPHSLILRGGSSLLLRTQSYQFDNQIVEFSQPQGPLFIDKLYNIWKRQLSQNEREASRYHHEYIIINENQSPFELSFICKSMYLDEKDLPVLLIILEQGETIDQHVLRQFLEKGVAVVQFCGRGTFSADLEHFIAGSRHNFTHFFDDLQAAVEVIGNNMTKNISLYCKGQVSSFVGLWFNIFLPYLFNSSVLHDGIYDLKDSNAVLSCSDFFGEKSQKEDLMTFNFDKFNILKCKFKTFHKNRVVESEEKEDNLQIGQLQNIIISSSNKHRLHSRKIIKRLRQNTTFPYNEVYLKEYEDSYSTDLHNLSYIYYKIRQRMEVEVNQIPEDEESND